MKNNFLLVDLNESKTKKLAETITSETSRKILNYLTEKDHDTEANMAKELKIPISTIHYHLQKLVEAKLVLVDEFHYSKKGREINHYKLANKYIIIAPKKVSGLKQALKNVLPVGIICLGIGAVIKLMTSGFGSFAKGTGEIAMEEAAMLTADAAPMVGAKSCLAPQPDIALWFLVGSISAIVIYLIVKIIKNRIK